MARYPSLFRDHQSTKETGLLNIYIRGNILDLIFGSKHGLIQDYCDDPPNSFETKGNSKADYQKIGIANKFHIKSPTYRIINKPRLLYFISKGILGYFNAW